MNYPAGWHLVPGSDQERFWDGEKWTGAYRPVATSASVTGSSTSGQAIASMVLGIISLVIWYVGIVTGIIGLSLGAVAIKKCRPKGPLKGRGMAIAGIVCSIIALALWLLVLVAALAVSGN